MGSPVRAHARMIDVIFSDKKKRRIPSIDPMRPKDIGNFQIPDGWIAEEKKDGSLTVQYVQDGAAAYLNRRGRDKTFIYPELTDEEPKKIKSKGLTITQGETYALKGRKDNFEAFLRRDLLQDPIKARERMKKYPLKYEAFDILMKDGKCLIDLPLKERKKILKMTIPKGLKDVKITRFSLEPAKFAKKLRKDKSVEGVVYKDYSSKYYSKKRPEWRKQKFKKEADVVITGYEKGIGKRKAIGILKANVWDKRKKRLKEVANVGTGFTDEQLANMKRRLDRGEKLFAKVEYLNLGSQGRLRMPSFKGLREDITIKETHT